LFHFLDILNNESDETFPAEIEKVLDVDEVLRYLAVSTLIVHLDNYIAMGHNYYLYEDNGRFVIIPWDLNMAFGTFNYGLNREKLINYYIDEPTGGVVKDRPLVYRLLSYQPYLDAYHGYLKELLDGPFAVDTMNSRIDELVELIRPAVMTDTLN
jgi:spore coat protein CotH